MKKYRKKPVVIEAQQWFPGLEIDGITIVESTHGIEEYGVIFTLEGEMKVSAWDWIIKGIKGEMYPCKPDIFDLTYEEV